MDLSRSEPAEFEQGGRIYSWVRTEPYRRVDGTESILRVFNSTCARCGEPFEVRMGRAIPKALNRRCAKHRRPGSKA